MYYLPSNYNEQSNADRTRQIIARLRSAASVSYVYSGPAVVLAGVAIKNGAKISVGAYSNNIVVASKSVLLTEEEFSKLRTRLKRAPS